MSCCGKTIEKIASIAKGNILFAVDKFFGLPKDRYEFAQSRLDICRTCEKQTWLTRSEYIQWLMANAKDVAQNFTQLETLPELPKQDYKNGHKLFCMVCKCYLPAKAWSKDEKCPLGKWGNV